jgi:uncharacterized protein involved in high-affinity Fe2+ transport
MFAYDPQTLTMTPIGTIYGADGTPHYGQKVAVSKVGTYNLLYVLPSQASVIQRCRIIEG